MLIYQHLTDFLNYKVSFVISCALDSNQSLLSYRSYTSLNFDLIQPIRPYFARYFQEIINNNTQQKNY